MARLEEALAALELEEKVRAERRARRPSQFDKKAFYASRAWHALRYRVIKENARRHGGVPTCEVCGAKRGPGVTMHCDHVVPLSVDWSRRLDPANCQVMCASCNLGKSNCDDVDWRPPGGAAQEHQRSDG